MSCTYPRNIELDTPLGKVWLAVTDADHIHVDANSNCKSLTVNRVEYGVSLHLFRGDDGKLNTRDYRDLYMSRVGTYKDPSDAARKKCLQVLVPAVQAWADANPEVFWAAAEAARTAAVNRLNVEIEELETKLSALKAECAQLVAEGC